MNTQDTHINFCQNLRHLRRVHRLTQKEMAQDLGISVSKIRRIESEDPSVRINSSLICQVCDRFGYTADAILYENWPQLLHKKSLLPGEGGSPKG